MRISYEKGMDEMARALEEYGHELFPNELQKECDAILCTSFKTVPNAGEKGALYVLTANKTPEQVDNMVRQRRYENLF